MAAAAVSVILWASAFVFIRSAEHAFSPGALALGRLLFGSLALIAIMVITGERFPPRPGVACHPHLRHPLVRRLYGRPQPG
ncbi:membrane protein [Nocardia seriolae]|uniref:Membrane protein n=2 Tax=Nocardia seriolae TaxID=37332 RepID=A0ABC9Z2G7_9NOCA|nr:membrane protein [Nocardia seriolae]GAP31939.1 membrane protein [Nocardia seriolae]